MGAYSCKPYYQLIFLSYSDYNSFLHYSDDPGIIRITKHDLLEKN